MTKSLFTDLNASESQDINGGWGFSASANRTTSYSYDKSFNTYNYSGNFSQNTIGNEATLGDNSQVGLFNQ
jgi:hypothetical protein